MTTPIHIGVDNGGTWIRFRATSSSGKVLWTRKKPSPSLEGLSAFLRRELCDFRERTLSLTIGSKGYWKRARQKELKHALRGLAREIVVMSDVEVTWLEHFKPGSAGIILISGTGSIAYGRNKQGAFARAGGLGPQKGDEGSGFWIGKAWLKKKHVKPQDVRRVASVVPIVIRRARAGDARAKTILLAAQHHLLHLIHSVRRRLALSNPVAVALHGSVLGNRWFRDGLKRLARRSGFTGIMSHGSR